MQRSAQAVILRQRTVQHGIRAANVVFGHDNNGAVLVDNRAQLPAKACHETEDLLFREVCTRQVDYEGALRVCFQRVFQSSWREVLVQDLGKERSATEEVRREGSVGRR